MANAVVVKDKGYKQALVRYSAMNGTKLFVGVPPQADNVKHGKSQLTISALAAIHEYGLGVPERSFIRAWFDENATKIRAAINVMAKAIGSGRLTQDQAMAQLGLKFVGEIQARIARNIPPPLDPKTIARKGSSVPLIDTGVLRSWISYIILINGRGSEPVRPGKGAK